MIFVNAYNDNIMSELLGSGKLVAVHDAEIH